jgi:hypothetical protein
LSQATCSPSSTPTKKPNPITPVGLFAAGQSGQGVYLARVAHAVLVGVLPHHELAKLRILRIELAGLGVKRRRQALQVGVATVPLTDLNLLKQSASYFINKNR